MQEAYPQFVKEGYEVEYQNTDGKWVNLGYGIDYLSTLKQAEEERDRLELNGRTVRILKHYYIQVWEII